MFYCPLAHALERMTYVYTAREQQMRANRKYQHLFFFSKNLLTMTKAVFIQNLQGTLPYKQIHTEELCYSNMFTKQP